MSQSIVKLLSKVFLNFEDSIKDITYSKQELHKRNSKLSEDYYSGRVRLKSGIKSDYIRIYQTEENMSIGFSFITDCNAGIIKNNHDQYVNMPEITHPITISIYQNNERFFKDVTLTELKEGLKSIYRTIHPKSFEDVIRTVFLTFKFSELNSTKIVVFEEFSAFDEIKVLTETEREDLDSVKSNYTVISKQRYELSSEIDKKVSEYRKELENTYQKHEGLTLNVLKQKEADALEKITAAEVKFVDKVVSYYNNFDISVDKFLHNIARKFQYGYFSGKGYDKALDQRIKQKK